MSGLAWMLVFALAAVCVAGVAVVRMVLAERAAKRQRPTSQRTERMTAVPSLHPFEQPVGSRDRRLHGKRRRRARRAANRRNF